MTVLCVEVNTQLQGPLPPLLGPVRPSGNLYRLLAKRAALALRGRFGARGCGPASKVAWRALNRRRTSDVASVSGRGRSFISCVYPRQEILGASSRRDVNEVCPGACTEPRTRAHARVDGIGASSSLSLR